MLRIIVRTDDASMAANVGGPVFSDFKTFDIHAPEVEAFLRTPAPQLGQRQVVGVELVQTPPA